MGYCSVFNEIWNEKLPKEWRYNIKEGRTVALPELASAIAIAQKDGRKFLADHPVCMTWKSAAEELLEQYEECIQMNSKKRKELGNLLILVDHCLRVAICSLFAVWVLSRYYYALRRFGKLLGV